MITYLIIPIIIGIIGGFLINYVSDTLPITRKLASPTCANCKEPISWLAYLLLKRCPSCSKYRSIRTWLIQILFPVLSVLIWLFPRPILPYPLAMLLLVYFLVVAVIDLEHRLVLHPVSIFGAVLGFGTGIFLRGDTSIVHGITSTLIGGIAGFGIMLILYYMGVVFSRVMAKRRGLPSDEVALGFGDVNLAGILGLTLGWPAISACLFFAILAGGLASLVIIAAMLFMKKYKAFTAIPYAPFLLLAAAYLLFS